MQVKQHVLRKKLKKDSHIHWYPGHIAKAERQLKEKLNLCDVVIEVLDARIPFSSIYTNIETLLGGKPRLVLLNKADLVDRNELKVTFDRIPQREELDADFKEQLVIEYYSK